MNRFIDRVVLVTGAARGIGSTIAGLFVQEGAKAFLVDVDKAALHSNPPSLRVST